MKPPRNWMIKVLVVDDSRVLTKIVSRILERDPSIQVIGTAENGYEAIDKIAKLKPDIVTLDIEMPLMNGIETLKHIMATNPLPVIMLSTLTRDHADITMEALALGACDFVTKDFSNSLLADKQQELITKIKNVVRDKSQGQPKSSSVFERLIADRANVEKHSVERSATVPKLTGKHEIVSIGASTGGPPALQYVLAHLPKDFPVPIVIAQHMPRLFTQSFAERLDKISNLRVKEAEDREPLQTGTVLIAPGDTHLALRRKGRQTVVELVKDGKYIYRPSVDLLMSTTATVFESSGAGVILTGMGNDGLEGMKELKGKGGYIIAQNEETCVVYGMPKAVVSAKLADAVLPIEKIPEEIVKVV
jgi:two-component system, chemotaxis family, protein-glutamate methylesterase/glutaminase